MACEYCIDSDGVCNEVSTVPEDFAGYNTLLTAPTVEE